MSTRTLLALTWLALATWPASAVDLAKLDAPLTKEPAYKASPQYCLVVFGPEAKHRVWVVIDGDTVYVDRNGNGDLTEAGEKLTLSKPSSSGREQYVEQRDTARITIRDGQLKHTDLQITQYRIRPDFTPKSESDRQLKALVAKNPKALVYEISVSVEVRGLPKGKIAFSGRIRQSAGEDAQGFLQFAGKRKDAPVVHFGGPLEMALLARQALPCGDKPGDLATMIGTRGCGPGSFASLAYSGVISEEVHPVADIQFPNKVPGKGPVKDRVVLKHRC
jgi:hypothetical protein